MFEDIRELWMKFIDVDVLEDDGHGVVVRKTPRQLMNENRDFVAEVMMDIHSVDDFLRGS